MLPKGSWVPATNRWHDERVDAAFTFAQWGACRQTSPLDDAVGRYTIGVDVQAGWQQGTIVVAAMRSDDRVGVEVHRHLKARPTQALTADDFLREIVKLTSKVDVERIVYAHSFGIVAHSGTSRDREGSTVRISYQHQGEHEACHDFAEAEQQW